MLAKVRDTHTEVDSEYYQMVLDRLSKDLIEEKYRLKLKQYERKNIEAQLAILEERSKYLANEEHEDK